MFAQLPTPIAYWDFRSPQPLTSNAAPYRLHAMNGPLRQIAAGLYFARGQWLHIPRAELAALNIHGPGAQVTVAAHLYRLPQPETYDCETIAGVWDESRRKRQYCLFLDLPIWDSGDQVGGHVSSHGGPTPGHPYCMDAAIGQTKLEFARWYTVGFTYDGAQAVAYLDGVVDTRSGRNPFPYPAGLFDGGDDGADFTVGAVNRSGEPGNFFHGVMSALAVFPAALSPAHMAALAEMWRARAVPVDGIESN